MAIVTPTDRAETVQNRCVIEVFECVCVLSCCFLVFFSVGVGAFVIRLSQISSFFSSKKDFSLSFSDSADTK